MLRKTSSHAVKDMMDGDKKVRVPSPNFLRSAAR